MGDEDSRQPSGNTLLPLYCAAVRSLVGAGLPTAAVDAMTLLRQIWPEADLTGTCLPSVGERSQFAALVAARGNGAPLPYLTGHATFMGRTFMVSPHVLIPRERTTAVLVQVATRAVRAVLRSRGRQALRIVDVGTGCGNVLLSVLASFTGEEVRGIGVDVSFDALEVARQNAALLDTAPGHIGLVQCDLGTALRGRVDVLTANLPYVASPGEHLRHEPMLAVRGGGSDGLDLFRLLLTDAPRVIAEDGLVCCEVPPSQADHALRFACDAFSDARLAFDSHGVPRALVAGNKVPDGVIAD